MLIAGLTEIHRGDHHDAMIFWDAGRALLSGHDPYAWIASRGWLYPLYYPLPAVLVVSPLAALPPVLFHMIWSGLGGVALGLAARERPALAPVLVSGAFFAAAGEGQWSPLLTAGAVLPWLAPLWIAKPSIGLALGVGWPHRTAVVGAVTLLALSFAVLPGWPAGWIAAVSGSPHHAPVMRPGGFLLVLALIRWRQPEARFLTACALIPHMVGVYEAVPLFLCCRTKWQGYALAVLTHVAALGGSWLSHGAGSFPEAASRAWPMYLMLVYLPALVMVVRRA